ncbi:hypothetical protein HPB51_015517 [Rhipicephalus microplus]|uniref:THAP-type domain-containing protein n=1 Tax=Rhipicephalus microplus TaxID=6941 RepID=A0A9J6DH89_RHIMP|nr:hypothetical protein HPB51_015517 [Rhipicephalus microplus]
MAKPVKRQTHCFAPGCSTGYVSARKAGVKRSVFTVPNDEDQLKAWQRYVPRSDKLLDRTAVLCEFHFERRFIVRDYTHIMNGEVVKIPRGRPCLTDDAIPSIFPNTPSYLSEKLLQKRSSRTSRGEVLGKKRKVNDENELPSMEHDSSLDVTTNGERVPGASCTVEKLEHMKDFLHLLKCARNSIVSTGLQVPEGRVRIDVVKEAWKCDNRDIVRLKAMPRVTRVVIDPNGFEKMKVNYAFTFFSDEMVRGCMHIRKRSRDRGVMRPKSPVLAEVDEFIAYLDAWERNVGKLGLFSQGYAEGLRVTLKSTMSIFEYLTKELGYKYLLTSRLSQDPLENVFGILRQMSGSNDHPTPTQFLLSANCLSFCSLAKAPANENMSPSVLKSLIHGRHKDQREFQTKLDELMNLGCLNEVHEILESSGIPTDHCAMVSVKSDSRVMHYVAVYVARRMLSQTKCPECAKALIRPRDSDMPADACLIREVDRGGLLYPSDELQAFIENMEDSFARCSSCSKLKANSIMDFISALTRNRLTHLGCEKHSRDVTNRLVKFYTMTRLHFIVKAENKAREGKRRPRMHYLKLRRVTEGIPCPVFYAETAPPRILNNVLDLVDAGGSGPSTLAILPPDNFVATVTDEESGDKNDTDMVRLPGSVLRAEIVGLDNASSDDDEGEPAKKVAKSSANWHKRDLKTKLPQSEWLAEEQDESFFTPAGAFEKFFDDDVIALLVKELTDMPTEKIGA